MPPSMPNPPNFLLPDHPSRRGHLALACLWLLLGGVGQAGPLLTAGDTQLRQDVQLLADHGVLRGPVTTWPLAWGPVLADLQRIEPDAALPAGVAAAAGRLRERAEWETRLHEPSYAASVSLAEAPRRIRGYADTPRESAELGGGVDWTGERLAVSLRGQFVDRDGADTEGRADGSMIGLALGNWLVSANTLDRWWGPGWDGSLILSGNARPIPAVALDRNFTDPFETRWLSWLGPWDLSLMMGQLESAREIPDTLFFGMRLGFRPLPSLEIGLSRTAQWCGDGRSCDLDVFLDLLVGRDNRGDDDISTDNEPGNQLAGVDFRWSQAGFGWPTAVYGQLIGEDEAGGFPSRHIGLVGGEARGRWRGFAWHGFAELAATTCQFYEASERFNCAYNHQIYRTGYRYRGRVIGHGADNDARIASLGFTLTDADDGQWSLLARHGRLNRGGAPDPRNTLTPVPLDLSSVDVGHRRWLRWGQVDVGLGYERTGVPSGPSDGDWRLHVEWRSAY